ncbi:MAG: type II toxin-antitoxin system RelB/DinJ family antitoxin [Lactobacillaceae bacterium]|jgi:DNA-damage-inducible protein J|nr:type II toxin-antitoxin system RelB/DinJ family antitoxin [Lactobacillaceae bacterium]
MENVIRKTSFTIRVNSATKQKADEIAENMGITLTAAINMFVEQFTRQGGMPFTPTTKVVPQYNLDELDPEFINVLVDRVNEVRQEQVMTLEEFKTGRQ